ncbi:hypothetical protein [Vreelandella titanicae]|uniref:Uncharacterized protein n=1 Tax=Vreelandella titanicae TaxID=664683 RepID=A0A558J3V0_9GAMM|nr:hypothetical protein [Halomonas titanicae]TVU88319.1 hypothetical protein FQP89_18875 [Halomonas titanicae]
MKLKFLAGAGLASYDIQGSMIEGIDTALFAEGSKFVGNEETAAVGIFDMFLLEGELHVVLAQPTKTTGLPWAARDAGWIDAADHVPGKRYVAATDANALALIEAGKAEYWRDPVDEKWSVRMVETYEEEPAK